MAWQAEEAARCDGCGLPRDETMHPDNEFHFTARGLVCFACEARERRARSFSGDPAGLYWLVDEDSR